MPILLNGQKNRWEVNNMWYLIRTLFFMWLLIGSVVLTTYNYFPQEIGLIISVGLFMATAISFADIMIRDKL